MNEQGEVKNVSFPRLNFLLFIFEEVKKKNGEEYNINLQL